MDTRVGFLQNIIYGFAEFSLFFLNQDIGNNLNP